MHPLLPNTTELSDATINEKINKIYKRMEFFSNMGNTEAYRQASIIYQELVAVMQERAFVAHQKFLDAAANNDNDNTDLIDIK